MKIKNGSLPPPAISFRNDPDTGIYQAKTGIEFGLKTEREVIWATVHEIENEKREEERKME